MFLVYMYYTHPSYQTSIVGKIFAYYIRIFMVNENSEQAQQTDLYESRISTCMVLQHHGSSWQGYQLLLL